MSYRTGYSRAIGLGAGKTGVAHWWEMKLTSIALIPLTAVALWPLGDLMGGADRAAVVAAYGTPFSAVAMMLFIAVTFRHLQQGLQVVIEDYIHHSGRRTAALLINSMFCAFFGLSGVFAVAKIAFEG